jgi:hypothetical protein
MKKHYIIIGGAVVIAALATFLNLTSQNRGHGNQASPIRADILSGSSTNTPSGNTISSIQEQIAKREYHITYDSARHAMQSPNRQHNLRAYYRPGNLSIQNRIDSAGQNFRMELVNEGVYADGVLIAKAGSDAVSDNRNDTLTIAYKGFTEEFINNQAGIRQNFIIDRAPTHTQQLSVRLSAHGLYARQGQAGQLVFYSHNKYGKKTDRLTYSDLKCWDANGEPLTARLAISGKQIEINVDVTNAAYPVTIDPIIANGNPANADKTLEIHQNYAWMGFSVSSAGDVNGDGFSDVLVGAPKYDNGQTDEGAAFLYPGTANGISLAATMLECNQAYAQMGYSVSNAGDINKDGFSDIMVGLPYYDASASNEGLVMIYKGSAGGLVTNNPYMFKLDQGEANLGISVAMAGDVNGDGFSDMLAGAHQFDNGQSNEGVGVLILGASNGLGLVTFLECNQPDAMMGFAVAGAGDVDGDGFSDVMAGARFYSNGQALEGAAFIFKGSANGLVTANPAVIEGGQVDARLGHALSSAGDVNGDGFSDIALGAYQYDKGSSNEGIVTIHYGSANGVSIAPSQTLESDQTEAQFGISVACAGDVNADGYADLIVGARYYDKGQNNEGAAFIYQGSKDGLNPVAISVLESNQGDAWMGSAVAPAGDVNGDGFSDVLVGSYAFDNGQKDEGSVFVWYGRNAGIDSGAVCPIISFQPNSEFGFAVSEAGDLNGDGFGDIIVGAPLFDNGQSDEGAAFLYYGSITGLTAPLVIESDQENAELGKSVAKAGDVNGDGFDDLVIGVVYYSNGELYEGAAFVFYGSSSGVDKNVKTTLEINQANAWFGRAVDGAGDVNGDGYEDVIVGAMEYDNNEENEGGGFLFYGSQTGIGTNPIKVLEINQIAAHLGYAVSGAGDVNADGFDDVLLGSPLFTNQQNNEGAALLYYGSSDGLKANPTIIEGDQIDANIGHSVSNAGDINGDGFADILIGAPLFAVNQNSQGAVFVYYGAAAGVSAVTKTTISINQSAYLGASVASAGDVNEDGYSDIVLGAIHYQTSQVLGGAGLLYYGSPNGVSQEMIVISSNIAFSDMGQSVSGAGDVNGDGVGDLIIGAPYYDNGTTMLFYGNKNLSYQNNLRLYNTDLTTPINHTQFPQTNFGAGLFAKSFTGRNKGKLIWETKPLAQGFSKGSNNRITNSTQFTGSQNAYSNLGTTGFELKNVIDKQGPGTKVRVRVKYDPVLALTGQSYGPWRYLPAYLMGNSTAPTPEEVENGLSENMRMEDSQVKNEARLQLAAIYPNPVSDRLNIDFKDKDQIQNLRILTATGIVVYQSKEFKSVLDVSKFSEGVYFLIITKTDGSHTTHKVLISR